MAHFIFVGKPFQVLPHKHMETLLADPVWHEFLSHLLHSLLSLKFQRLEGFDGPAQLLVLFSKFLDFFL